MGLRVIVVLSLTISRLGLCTENLTALSHDVSDLGRKLVVLVKPFVKEDRKCIKDVATQLGVVRSALQVCDPDWPLHRQRCSAHLASLVTMLESTIAFIPKSCEFDKSGE